MAIRMAGKGLTDFLGVKPAYGDIGGQAIGEAAKEAQTIAYGNAQTTNAMLKGMADIQAAEHIGEAAAAQGAASGQSAMVGGIASGIGGLGGLFGSRGGGSSFGNSGWGSYGDYSGGLSGTPISGMFG